MSTSKKYSTVFKALRPWLVMVAVLSLIVSFTTPPQVAQGLSVKKTTASSNQIVGNQIIGGVPTRITWEAMVDKDEDVKSITIVFPQGTSLGEAANTKATVLDGTKRLDVKFTSTLSHTQTVVTFDEPIEQGLLIRLEMYYIALPEESGEYTLTGSYTDGAGRQYQLEESPEISVVSATTVSRQAGPILVFTAARASSSAPSSCARRPRAMPSLKCVSQPSSASAPMRGPSGCARNFAAVPATSAK